MIQFVSTDENGNEWINNQVKTVNPGSGIATSEVTLENSLRPQTINIEPILSYSVVSDDCNVQLPFSAFESEFSISSQEECVAFLLA